MPNGDQCPAPPSFNGRTLRSERRNRGSNPRGGANFYMPQDGGLKEPVRAFADTFSAVTVLMERFFPTATR